MTDARTPLISRKTLFGNPDRVSPRISPDGSQLSFIAPRNGVLNVWVAPVDHPDQARPITDDRKRGIRMHGWAYNSRHVLYVQDADGDENWNVHAVDLSDESSRNLTPFEGVSARIQHTAPEFPDEILVGLNNRDEHLHDVHRVDVCTGRIDLLQQNDGFAGFVTDDTFAVRFAMRMTDDGGSEILAPGEDGWEVFAGIGQEDVLTTGVEGFDRTGRIAYWLDSRGRDTAALTAMNLDTGGVSVVAEDPRADVSDVMRHPTKKTVEAVAFTYGRKRWTILDDSVSGDLEHLRTVSDGDVEVTSRSLDDRRWIVAYLLDNGPVRYYLYDRDAGVARFLFTNRSALEGLSLARMHPVEIEARDGLELVSYLTLPVESAPDESGRPESPLPTVLYVHGGPWARDHWGYHPYHQLLANRGYAVLSVNYRGSTGFGKRFANAANKEWAGRMHDDLIDAVDWAISAGVADPKRVAIMGGSYGGYATLVGLTFTPEVFACGVDIVGPSNLVTLLETVPPYWQPMVELWATRVGDHRTEEGRRLLNERSPLNYVDRIKKPLLIAQGANDPRVKQSESNQIVSAMEEKGIPVTYVLYSDEGHGFARPENNLSFTAVAEAFLAQTLGGRHEPIGDDFEGSSVEIKTGAEFIKGLEQAWATREG